MNEIDRLIDATINELIVAFQLNQQQVQALDRELLNSFDKLYQLARQTIHNAQLPELVSVVCDALLIKVVPNAINNVAVGQSVAIMHDVMLKNGMGGQSSRYSTQNTAGDTRHVNHSGTNSRYNTPNQSGVVHRPQGSAFVAQGNPYNQPYHTTTDQQITHSLEVPSVFNEQQHTTAQQHRHHTTIQEPTIPAIKNKEMVSPPVLHAIIPNYFSDYSIGVKIDLDETTDISTESYQLAKLSEYLKSQFRITEWVVTEHFSFGEDCDMVTQLKILDVFEFIKDAQSFEDVHSAIQTLLNMDRLEIANWLSNRLQQDALDYLYRNYDIRTEYDNLPIFTQLEGVKTALQDYNTVLDNIFKRVLRTAKLLFTNSVIEVIKQSTVLEDSEVVKIVTLRYTVPIVTIPQMTQYMRAQKTITLSPLKSAGVSLSSEFVNPWLQELFRNTLLTLGDSLLLIDKSLNIYQVYHIDTVSPNVGMVYTIERYNK